MKGSNGPRRGTRKLQVKHRDKGKVKIGRYLQSFKDGDIVAITIDPSYQTIPNHRFQGKTGNISGRQGRAYYVKVREGSLVKKLLITPEHLTPVK